MHGRYVTVRVSELAGTVLQMAKRTTGAVSIGAMSIPIYLEIGTKRVFASAIDWPGWSRTAKTPELAIDALAEYADRYRTVVELAGLEFAEAGLPLGAAEFVVVEQVAGSATTDFGAPDRSTASDAEPVTSEQGARLSAIVEASWTLLDSVVASAPEELRKGPRGGGRDRDAVFQHVVAAEAAYARKAGVRLPTPKPGDSVAVQALRDGVLSTLAEGTEGEARWSRPYAARRIAWHVLDHAWEIQDRSV
jgi:hypothetical protein